ncbi:MAG: nicotinate-nucleotide adenylyltransferase [Prevotellaceae bacterium]|jgi:nicotinate-nucleotide adenylyltransferase|nr:nicotinate-nucleotide adenylyltransferase [Prevotellaceae bacterium]
MKHKTAILPGSFNPLHIGHVAIANYVAEYMNIEDVWFVVSPHNPLKQVSELFPVEHRLKILEIAIANLSLPFKTCDIELDMPKPSFTIDMLNALSAKYRNHEFTLLMGADSIADIEHWKDYKDILANYQVFVYPRMGYDAEALCEKYKVNYVAAPVMEISATFIRDSIHRGMNIEAFLPYGVYQYIMQYKLYK